jgi:spore coat polysaccharide biosynthesis predicted glycosyltransferase SpsG
MLTIVNVILFANATHSTGLGHLIRSLNFIRYYVEGAHVIIIGEISSPHLLARFKDLNIELVESAISKFGRAHLMEILSFSRIQAFGPQLIVIDNPYIEFNIELDLESFSAKIVTFLDYPHRETQAGFVISTNALDAGIKSSFERIMKNPKVKLYIGPEYFVLDKNFYSRSIPDSSKSNRITANFGASDPGNYMKRLLEIVTQDQFGNFNFDLVLGPMSNVEIPKTISWPRNIKVSREYGTSFDFWSVSEVAVGSVGISFLERMYLGIPTLAVPQTPEQLAEAERFAQLGQGLVLKNFLNEDLALASEELLEYLLNRERVERIRGQLIA